MSLIIDGVFSSTSFHGRGMFRFDRISYDNKMLLKSISKEQRRKFKKFKLIPWQLLHVLWNLNFLPGTKAPQEGMRVHQFLKFLYQGEYQNEQNRSKGLWLREKIEEEEYSSITIIPEIFIEYGRKKFVAVSIAREEPGTIFR